VNSSLWKIPTEFSVCDSLCNWHDEQCSRFTDRIYFVGINDTSSFFCFVLNLFPHYNSLGIYWGNIFVGEIRRQFTNGKISSIFLFVFIDFLVVIEKQYVVFLLFQKIRESLKKIQKPITDLWSVESLSWSALKYARSYKKKVDGSKTLLQNHTTFWKEKNLKYEKINYINQTYSSRNNFTPKHTRNRNRQQERTSSFNNVPMFSSNKVILLRSIYTRSLVNSFI
jgi:hypothetical protein